MATRKRKGGEVEEDETTSPRRAERFQRHRELIHAYTRAQKQELTAEDVKTLIEHHEFVRDESRDGGAAQSWQIRLAKKYYARLFKEYALADLSRYKESKVGLRWRTEREVLAGKGQFICGNKRCEAREELRSYEVPFRYEEHGEVKNELVKVRVCTDCARKLFYKKTKEVQRMAKKKRTDAQGAEEMLLSLPERETLREESPGVQAQPSEQFVGAVAQAPDVERKKWIEPPAKEKTADERMDEYLSDLFM